MCVCVQGVSGERVKMNEMRRKNRLEPLHKLSSLISQMTSLPLSLGSSVRERTRRNLELIRILTFIV